MDKKTIRIIVENESGNKRIERDILTINDKEILIVKVGNNDWPAKVEEMSEIMKAFEKAMSSNKENEIIVTNHMVSMEKVKIS